MNPNRPTLHVSHETIYCATYALPRPELHRNPNAQLRFANKARMSRRQGQDQRGQLPGLRLAHLRPMEAATRFIFGHWEGNLIEGVRSRLTVSALVDCKNRYLLITKLHDCAAEALPEHFTRTLAMSRRASVRRCLAIKTRRWRAMRFWLRARRSTSTSPTLTVPGSARPTSTPMA